MIKWKRLLTDIACLIPGIAGVLFTVYNPQYFVETASFSLIDTVLMGAVGFIFTYMVLGVLFYGAVFTYIIGVLAVGSLVERYTDKQILEDAKEKTGDSSGN